METSYPLNNYYLFLPLPAASDVSLFSVSRTLPNLDIPCIWDHTICGCRHICLSICQLEDIELFHLLFIVNSVAMGIYIQFLL